MVESPSAPLLTSPRVIRESDLPRESPHTRVLMTDSPYQKVRAVLTYREAATYLGLTYGSMRNLISEGKGPRSVSYFGRDRRFAIADLDEFISLRTNNRNRLRDKSPYRRPQLGDSAILPKYTAFWSLLYFAGIFIILLFMT